MTYVIALIFLVVIILMYFVSHKSEKSGIFSGLSGQSPVLDKYSRDLTGLARQKKLDPVIGRQKEIARVIQILSRRTKNNPLLIGGAGVGKTAISEGLAEAIVQKNVPAVLYDKRVMALDLSGILAGTKYRGEFEQRLKRITDEILAAKRSIILFIDEIHILAEAGEAEGAINASDILKPLLARGELQVVGATTKEEYEKYIKQDKTLDRRLQPIIVNEPTPKETESILNGIKPIYEKYHNVTILPAAILEAVNGTRNIHNRYYPDKAIDAIDESCSKVRIDNVMSGKKQATNPKVTAQDVKLVIKQWKSDI